MKRVLTAAVLIPLVLLAVFRAPLWLFALLITVVVILAIREYLDILEAHGIQPFRRTTYAMGVIVVLGFWCAWDDRIWQYLLLIQAPWLFRAWEILLALPLIFGIPLVFRRDLRAGLAAASASAFGMIYIAASLALLIPLRSDWHSSVLVSFILLSVWLVDPAVYDFGRSLVRRKLAPVVRPKKTWEASIASVLASV